MPDHGAVAAAVAAVHRQDWGRVLAATVRVCRDLDLAEDCTQQAYAEALERWPDDGIPANPAGWLITTARRRAIDAIRRQATLRAKLPLLVEPIDPWDATAEEVNAVDRLPSNGLSREPARDAIEEVPDERLRLIFLCCHPALAQDAQLALTLRLVCGVPAADIARLLLVSETTMAARITRAKKKIRLARIPFRMPRAADLPDRLRSALGVIHLLFSSGHAAPSGARLIHDDAADRAIALGRLLTALMPDEPEVRGLLALMLVIDARRATRVTPDGNLQRLEDQDRSRWDRATIAEADALIVGNLRAGNPGRYTLQAAIAALYAEAPSYQQTDWGQLVVLYDRLLQIWPSPVVALNRSVPLAMVAGPEAALKVVEEIEEAEALPNYPYLPAVKADLLRRLGRPGDAAVAYRRAIDLTANEVERRYLQGRLDLLGS